MNSNRFYIDFEFNGFGGEAISLGITHASGESLYLVYPIEKHWKLDPWVKKNVIPILWDIPKDVHSVDCESKSQVSFELQKFLKTNSYGPPYIISDWPEDIKFFCEALITGPGQMINISRCIFDVIRVDAYPTKLLGAVQHNSSWDSLALWYLLEKDK